MPTRYGEETTVTCQKQVNQDAHSKAVIDHATEPFVLSLKELMRTYTDKCLIYRYWFQCNNERIYRISGKTHFLPPFYSVALWHSSMILATKQHHLMPIKIKEWSAVLNMLPFSKWERLESTCRDGSYGMQNSKGDRKAQPLRRISRKKIYGCSVPCSINVSA